MLKGERVLLRPIEREDIETLAVFEDDYEIHKLADDEPYIPRSADHFQRIFEERLKKPDSNAAFAIEVDGRLIGSCVLMKVDATHRNGAVGIMIGDRDSWGKGYGREAFGLLLQYAFDHRNLHHVTLDVLANNERAIRSYRALGFVEEGRLREHAWFEGEWVDSIEMGILREEWVKRNTT